MTALTTGIRVDQFCIVRKLGRGGMSEVYLARDITLGRKVALKLIRTEKADSPRRLELFLREARLTAKFAHPHIITIYSVGKYNAHPYLALEYLQGQTLAQRMRQGPMSAPETIRIGLAIAQALEEAHSHGVLHRDLKPANVIIPQDGRLRVLDFGISELVKDSGYSPASLLDAVAEIGRKGNRSNIAPEPSERKHTEKATATAYELQGTPSYMAPERWLGHQATGAADVWALGVILYKMLTLVHPFLSEDRSIESIAQSIVLTQQPPSLPQDLNIPPEFSELITSMLSPKALSRPQAQTVVEVLQKLCGRKRTQLLESTSPFRGLLPFSERHADLFFGRNAEIEMAIERLRHEPVLPVVGTSGAGKSSFVAAGIIPRLREMERWLVLKVRPGTDPLAALSATLQASWFGESASISSLSARDVELDATELTEATDILPKGKNHLEAKSSDSPSKQAPSSKRTAQNLLENPATLLLELQALADVTRGKVMLFVDQLEELYTLDHSSDLRRAYMEAISRAADDPEGPIRVIFTLRDDFLGRIADSPSAREALSHITVLRAPEEEALYEVVTKPVELAGYSYEDSGLPEEMIDAVRDAPASLPLLQFACSQLWNRRDTEKRLLTRAAYEAMGGVEGALASKADELLAGLSEVQRNVVRQLMLRLVTPDGTRRVVAKQELLDGLDSSAGLVLDRLTAVRMVVSRRAVGTNSTEAELELVHDSLIHSWAPLVRWLEQSREEVVFLDEVSRAAELWNLRGCPKNEVWSGGALEEALVKIERCEAVPKRVKEFLKAGELQHQVRARWRRNIIIAFIGALFSIIAMLTLMNRETEIQRERAVTLMEEAQKQRDRERQARASSLREGARAAYINGDFLEARSKLRASFEAHDSTQARALWWLLEKEPQVWSKTLGGYINWVSISPDGQSIAVTGGLGSIHIYDTKTLESRILRGHKGRTSIVEYSPEGRYLSTGSDDHEIRIWDLSQETFKVLNGHTDTIWSLAFSPDGKRLISGSRDQTIKVWDIQSGTTLRTLKTDTNVGSASFSADGRFIISLNLDEKISIRDAQNYEINQIIRERETRILDAVTSADGKLLAYCGTNGLLVVLDLEKRQEITRISSGSRVFRSLSFSRNSDFVATATSDGEVLVWDTKSQRLHNQFQHSTSTINSVAFLPDGKQLISAGNDGSIKLWKTNVASLQKENAGHSGPLYAIAYTLDGKTIITGGVDGDLRFWDVDTGQSIRTFHGLETEIIDIELHQNGKLLAAAGFDGSIRLWTLPEGKLLKTLNGHKTWISSIEFSPDGKQLVSASHDQTLSFWDLESLTKNKSLSVKAVINYMDIDPEGHLLATVNPQKVEVRNIKTGKILRTFSGHSADIKSVVFSHDGRWVYSASRDGTVRRHQLGGNLTDGQVVARHSAEIYWIDIVSTEEILGTPSADTTAKIWNIGTEEVITLRGHQDEVNRIRFSPDGTIAATVSDDNTIRLWDRKTGRPLWYSLLIFADPPLLLTRQGLLSFDDNAEPTPTTKEWQKALETRGKMASITSDHRTLCFTTFTKELELWDISNDNRTVTTEHSEIQQVLAFQKGCLTRSDGTLTLTKTSGDRVVLGKHVDAMSRLEDFLLVLQEGNVRILDRDWNQQDEFTVTAGASSLTIVEDRVALGFPDGSIEVWRQNESSSEKIMALREVDASPVTRIIPGPPSTIIAGFANGSLGIWSLDTGERLLKQRLHGPVIHLLHKNQTVWAATELGSRLQLDLSMFYADYCDLMNLVWSSVPWVWEEGRARFRERPRDHACARP